MCVCLCVRVCVCPCVQRERTWYIVYLLAFSMKNLTLIIFIHKTHSQMKRRKIYSSLLTKEQNFSGTLMRLLLNICCCLFGCWYLYNYHFVTCYYFFFFWYWNEWKQKTTLFWCIPLVSPSHTQHFHLISLFFFPFFFIHSDSCFTCTQYWVRAKALFKKIENEKKKTWRHNETDYVEELFFFLFMRTRKRWCHGGHFAKMALPQ